MITVGLEQCDQSQKDCWPRPADTRWTTDRNRISDRVNTLRSQTFRSITQVVLFILMTEIKRWTCLETLK